MSPSTPFIDTETGSLDIDRIQAEAYPLAGLIMLFGSLALIPFVFTLLFGASPLGIVFTIIAQFVLAIGTGIVLIYVVARGIQIAEE